MAASTANYTIPRGIFYFTPEGGTERDLGNVSNASLTLNVEFLDHFSSRAGIRSKDLSVPVQIGGELSLTLDEWQLENLALAVLGTVSDQETGDPGYVDGATEQNKKIAMLNSTSVVGQVRMVGTNSVGVKVEVLLPRVSFKSGNQLSLIADEWGTIEVGAEILYDETSGSYGDIFEI